MGKEEIKGKVAVIGVGCCKFGENFDKSADDMIIEAVYEAYEDAKIDPKDIQAAWVGMQYSFTGLSGATISDPLKLYGIPISHVENYCASGMDAFRNACFGIVSGAYDIVLAMGVEKILDHTVPGRGLPGTGARHPLLGFGSAPGAFGLAATRHFKEFGVTKEDLARIAVKNHKNGAKHPKAHFQREITIEDVLKAPMIAYPLGLYDCCPVTDGAAAVILTRTDIAKSFRDDYILVEAIALAVYSQQLMFDQNFDYLTWLPTVAAAKDAYEQAGIKDPRKEIDFAEVHDCFTITELLNYEDLDFCKKGEGAKFIKDGIAEIDGELPVNPSGGLKSFGHPIGATGCRMIYELTKQLQNRADGYQVKNPEVGLAHNLGGPGGVICSITILSNRR